MKENGIARFLLITVHTSVSILNVLETTVYGNNNWVSILTCT